MSVEHSNIWNCSKMCQTSENLPKHVIHAGKIVDSKIRKFYFLLQDKEIERDLRVTISVCSDEKHCDQYVLLELTNDANPVFLFLLSITKHDFNILRTDQGLNMEFQDFPKALVNLLEHCKDCVTENGERFKLMLVDYCGTAAGGRIMDMSKIQIKIVEECPFRNICHLTLDIIRGTELQIRQKLEAEVYKVSQSLLKTSKLHDEALIKISELVEEINEKNKIIENSDSMINHLKSQKDEECYKIRSQAEDHEKSIRDECNQKIIEERKHFEKQFHLMQTKVDNLEKELRLFYDKELETQNLLHEKEREKELIEVDLFSKKQEIIELRNQNEKLDGDYHDKEKTVNILRTRLAVAEQELKDNNLLIANNQTKMEEAIQEKLTFQTNLEYLQNKLEKKEFVIKNLSDEIIKANDIIAKQQSKISTFSSKLSECESAYIELEQSCQLKEEDVSKQNKVVSKLQEDVAAITNESKHLKEKIDWLEKNNKQLNISLQSKENIILELRDNFESIIQESHLDLPKKSLLAYRTFLSLPSLLPSDDLRYTDDLWDFVVEDRKVSKHQSHLIDSSSKRLKITKLIKPYIYRYLKRFYSIPLSLFKSSTQPLTVLIAPNGLQSSEPKPNVEETINHVTEYAIYNKPIEHYQKSVQFIPSVKDVERNKSTGTINTEGKDELGDNSEYSDNFGLGFGSLVSPPSYAPVGAFRLKPSDRIHRSTQSSMCRMRPQLVKETCQTSIPSNVRKTPAVGAPPLTPEQRNAVESVFKASRSHWIAQTLRKRPNSSLPQSLLHKQRSDDTIPSVSPDEMTSHHKIVAEPALDVITTVHFNNNRRIARSKAYKKPYNGSESLHCSKSNGILKFNPSPESEAYQVSVDFSEPSAYFAT